MNDRKSIKSLEELAHIIPEGTDVGMISLDVMKKLIERELKKHEYELYCEDGEDLLCDIIEEMADAIFEPYPEAVFSVSKEFDTNIAFYFKKTPDVVTEERWAIALNKNWMKKIE